VEPLYNNPAERKVRRVTIATWKGRMEVTPPLPKNSHKRQGLLGD